MINHVKRLGIPSTQTLEINIEPSTKSLKRGTVITSEKDTPQPAHALQEFVKHIADPLVNKGWNLHLKFWKRGVPGGTVCTRFFSTGVHS